MTRPEPGTAAPSASWRPDRRELMTLAATAAGAGVTSVTGAAVSDAGRSKFPEPSTAAEYASTMKLGTQAGDFLEMPAEQIGLRNQLRPADFEVLRNEGKFDHLRIPACCQFHADADGRIEEDFLQKLDAQIALALEAFPRVVIDPLHHYGQWKGRQVPAQFQPDAERVAQLTAEQHGVRATAMWTQMATRYRDVSRRLSFDLFNEPGINSQSTPGFPPPQTPGELNDWYAAVVPAIRATGGRNVQRMLWLEPFYNRLDLLQLPADAGPVGVSPHYYTPFTFTHRDGSLSAAGMASLAEDVKYARRWGEGRQVPMWVGEIGVSRSPSGSKVPRSPADRAEYIAHVRNTALEQKVPVCYWAWNNDFALYDQSARQWMPDMRQAVSGLPTPLPVRPIPAFIQLKGGRIARSAPPNRVWPGFSYDPATGILTAQSNVGGPDRGLVLVFPDIPVASGETWISRATEFSGNWSLRTSPLYADDSKGLDVRAVNAIGRSIYPGSRAAAPGGFENDYGIILSDRPFFGIDLNFAAGSPAGSIRFACLRAS